MSLITLESKPTGNPSSGTATINSGETLTLQLKSNKGISPYATVYASIAKAGEEDFDRAQGNGVFWDRGPDAEDELAVEQPESTISPDVLTKFKGQEVDVRIEIEDGETSTHSEVRRLLVK